MALFEVAIVENPTEKEAKDGKLEKLIFGPAYVIAKNTDSAAMKTLLEHQGEIAASGGDYERLQVLVRPFA